MKNIAINDIVERLAIPRNPAAPDADVTLPFWVVDLICDAHMELTAARARIAELEGALEPFAAIAEHDIGDDETDTDFYRPMATYNVAPRPTVGLFRRARAILKGN